MSVAVKTSVHVFFKSISEDLSLNNMLRAVEGSVVLSSRRLTIKDQPFN